MPHHALDNILLTRLLVAARDEHPARDVAGDATAQNYGRKSERSRMIVDAPCARTKRDLQAGVEIQQDDDDDEELERECVVRLRLMRFVERVRLREFPFVVLELGLLFFGQDRVVV